MKKLWDNSSKLYKAIAIVLTLIMVVTPLYIHFEKRYDAKAAGEISIETVYYYNEASDWAMHNDIAKSDGSVRYGFFIEAYPTGAIKINYTDGVNMFSKDILSSERNVIEVTAGTDTSNYKVTGYEDEEGTKTLDEAIPFPKLIWDNNSILDLSVAATVNGTDFAGNLINCKSGDVLEITITTGYGLTGLNIFGTDDTDIPNTYEGGNYDTDFVRTYRYTYTFSGSSNEVYSNNDIIAYDEKNPLGKTISCSSLIYDINKPVITEDITSPATGYTSGETYSNYTYNYKITSGGDDISQESELKEAYYIISGAKEDSDNGRVDLTVPSNTKEFTGNITVPVSNTNSGTTIEFHAKDKAGNENTKTIKIIIDDTPPTNPEVKYLRGGDEISAHSGTYYLKPDDTIKITTSDNFNLKQLKIYDGTTYDESNILYTEDYILNETFGEYSARLYGLYNKATAADLSDGSYNLGIRAYDWAKNGSDYIHSDSPASFTIDGTAPQQDGDVELWYLETGTWHQVTSDMLDSDNVFYYNSQKYAGLEYRVKIVETNFDANTDIYLKSSNNSDGITGFSSDGGYYNHSIPVANASLQPVGEAVEYTIYAVDYAGNDLTITGLPKICVVDTDIRFSDLSLKDSDGHSIATDEESLAAISQYSNKVYTLSVTVKSGFELSTISLKYDDTDTKTLTEGTDFTDSTEDYTNLHYAEVEFKIPAEELGELANKRFKDMQLYAEDDNGEPASVDIPLLMYDSTKPIVSSTADGSTKITVDNEWHKSYSLAAYILSGTNATESDLKSAGYNYTGTDVGADKTYTVTGTSITDTIDIPESNNVNGTTIKFKAEDNAGNKMEYSTDKPNSFTIKVDGTKPAINTLTAGGNETNTVALTGNPSIGVDFKDNLTIGDAKISVTLPDGTSKTYNCSDVAGEEKDISVAKSYALSTLIGKNPSDGSYKVKLDVNDKAGNSVSKEITFDVDNTAPEFLAEIISGTSGKSNGYYNTNVVVRFTVKDNNFDASNITVTDNGSTISPSWSLYGGEYVANVTFNSEGRHDVVIRGTDKSGTAGVSKQVDFIIDKSAPTVSLLVNGGISYNESMGVLNLTSAANINVSVSDKNEDSGDLRVQVIKTVPDTATTTTEYLPTSNRNLTFSDEADYTINIYAVDKANNQSSTRTISFRIDTTAPTLTISGVNGGTSSSAVSVGFNITESFWQDASGTVTIYRKAGDGKEEALYKTLNLTPTQRAYTLSELLSDTGVYRFEFEARDRVGHTANTTQTITIDTNKPDIRLSGVNNYDVTDGIVSIAATISDEFYLTKTVSATGTVTNADGTKSPISFSGYQASGNPTSIEKTFSEDGIYDIVISSRDVAGNESTSSVHFTIDTTAPVIGDLSKWDGKTVNSIDLDIDLDELVSDLTVCEVHMYLNGSEYDDVSDLEDGAYTLLITAEDELGHISEKSASFVLDTKGPVFIVTGVEDGEVKDENYDIEISLQLDEDKLTKVTLNDKAVLLSNNNTTATLKVTDRGVYELYMEAEDPAGNKEDNTISFIYGDESMAVTSDAVTEKSSRWWIWIIVAAAALGCGGFIFVLLKRRRE